MICLGFAVAAGVSCMDDEEGDPTLAVEPDVVRPGEVVKISLGFEADEGTVLIGATGTELERRQGDKWLPVAFLGAGTAESPGRPVVYKRVDAIAGTGSDGETTDYSLMPQLRPGTYRVIERVNLQREDGSGGRELTLTDELRLERREPTRIRDPVEFCGKIEWEHDAPATLARSITARGTGCRPARALVRELRSCVLEPDCTSPGFKCVDDYAGTQTVQVSCYGLRKHQETTTRVSEVEWVWYGVS